MGAVGVAAAGLGFHITHTYDHLSWRVPFRDRTWFGALPTLTAAATATERLRLGTLATSVRPFSPVAGRPAVILAFGFRLSAVEHMSA
ncbi:hypothetical protein GCM10028832_34660 [Streptomyces sparsus]